MDAIFEWNRGEINSELDVCVTAINRPLLLENTLNSFFNSVLLNWNNCKIVMNVDPIPCTGKKDQFCKIAQKYFNSGIIKFSEKGNFADAVKWTWSNTCSEMIFHLEDDWICLASVKRVLIESLMKNSSTVQVRLPKRHQYMLYNKMNEGFSLNPSFIKGSWARKIGAQLRSEYDPEKQIRHKLIDTTLDGRIESSYILYRSITKFPVIFDSGTIWKKKVGLIKETPKEHVAIWRTFDSGEYSKNNSLSISLRGYYLIYPIIRLVVGSGQITKDLIRSIFKNRYLRL